MTAHTPSAPITIENELERNIALLKSHGEAIQRLKSLEAELSQLEADERHQFERYGLGYSNTLPPSRDADRQRLTTLIAEARPLARAAEELSIEPLTAVQREIRARISASKAGETKSLVERMLDEDEADAEQIDALAEGIRDVLHKRKAARLFLSEQGRALVARGDHANGTAVLRLIEQAGPVRVPGFDLDQRKVQTAIAAIAATFARRKAGQ